MEPVLIVGPLTDVSLAITKLLMQKGIGVYVVTDLIDEWNLHAPEIVDGNSTITTNPTLPFLPKYIVYVPGAHTVNQDLLATSAKKVSVLSRGKEGESPSFYGPLSFPLQSEVDPLMSAEQKADQILRYLFSFGGNTTIFTDINKLKAVEKKLVQNAVGVKAGIKQTGVLVPPKIIKTTPSSTFRRKRILWMVMLILFIFSLPFTILGVATALSLAGLKLTLIGEYSLARSAFAASNKTASAVSLMPLVGENGSMLQRVATAGERGTHVLNDIDEIMSGVFGKSKYPLEELSSNLQKELLVVHRELSFLEAEIKKGNSIFLEQIPMEELSSLRLAAYSGADIAGRLPSLLGIDTQKTYLVLLQNNMELRPTGGFIGSFALLNFSGGRLVDAPVYDVYSADGQLKGHVEPPEAIKKYLGEANWYLRDSNWDADFPTSAKRAEWFMDKTIEVPVDGVVAIDLEFVRQLIASQGGLDIADFDMKLTKDNFYEVIQNEVHKDFFPGSRKKAAVLTSTMNALMTNLLAQIENKDLSLAESFSNSLSQKHVQLHIKDPVIQQQINVLGWSGEAVPPACDGNCEQIWLGLVEANVGVNKANYFIDRSAKLNSTLATGLWEHELSVTLTNSARGEGVDGEHDYKTYLRVMAPRDANFDRVTVKGPSGSVTSSPEVVYGKDRVEAGVLVEVPAGQSRVVTFLWSDKASVDLENEGTVKLYWRKQAGTVTHPVEGSINLPGGRRFEYNADLGKDLVKAITF